MDFPATGEVLAPYHVGHFVTSTARLRGHPHLAAARPASERRQTGDLLRLALPLFELPLEPGLVLVGERQRRGPRVLRSGNDMSDAEGETLSHLDVARGLDLLDLASAPGGVGYRSTQSRPTLT